MTTYLVYRSPEDMYSELQRAKHKIRCMLRDGEKADALIEELQREKIALQDANEDVDAECQGFKKKNRKLKKQLNAKERKIVQLCDELKAIKAQFHMWYLEQKQASEDEISMLCEKNAELAIELGEARALNDKQEIELKAMTAQCHMWYLEQKQASEYEISMLCEKNAELKMELGEARELNDEQHDQIANLMSKSDWLEEEVQCVRSASVRKEQSMFAEVKELKKIRNGLQKQLKQLQAQKKPRVQSREHAEMMQRQQMEQRRIQHEKADKSKVKRRRRRTEKGMATNELAEGNGDAQRRCDAEEAPSEEREKAVEDEMMVFSEPSQSSNVYLDANEATGQAEGDIECKETKYSAEPLQKKEVDTIVSREEDSEELPSSSPESVLPSQPVEMVVQSVGTASCMATDWTVPHGISAVHSLPQARKRRRSFLKLTVAAKRRSVLISQATNTIVNYKQRPAILRPPFNLSELRIQKKKIAELKARVNFLLELHEKNDEEFTKVSVEFQKTCEQFTPRHHDINQLVIKKLPQISREEEYWCTVFQAVLGLSTTACSSCNWQSVFSYWLSGRGRGPPVWETLIDAFETSNIMVLQRIANCLKATLHESVSYSRVGHDGRCIACGQPLPQAIEEKEEEDLIFISQEESTATD